MTERKWIAKHKGFNYEYE